MEQVIIFGSGNLGLRLKRMFENQYEISFFCDNNLKKQGKKLDGISIISFEELAKMIKTGIFNGSIIIAVEKVENIVTQIRNSKISVNVYGCSRKYLLNNDTSEVLYPINYKMPRLSYFEYHVSQHCNLKCKGCGHYSNITDEEFGDLEKYKKDLMRLKELYWGVEAIRLMGGEPLLNKKLPEFIYETRLAFPDADIRVVTNGLLIPRAKENLFRVMKKNAAIFDISQYKPTSKHKEEIELKCLENDVFYIIPPLIESFRDNDNEKGDSFGRENFEKCYAKKCHFLMDGKISVCCKPILHEKYKHKMKYKMEITNKDIINIYDISLNGFMLNEFLSNPIDACRYCDNINLKWFAWEGNYPHL